MIVAMLVLFLLSLAVALVFVRLTAARYRLDEEARRESERRMGE